MIAKHLVPRSLREEEDFRWRGGDVSRLETLSDAVFALSLTFLVVSLDVPRDFQGLASAFLHLPAFAVCFVFLIWIWYSNFLFHRRFGMEDAGTVTLTAMQLFLILAYVFPLKFLATWLLEGFFPGIPKTVQIDRADMPTLMILYSSGSAGIFLLSILLNLRAYRRRDLLQLDARERLQTRSEIQSNIISMGISLTSVLLASLSSRLSPWAGMIYFLMGPLQGIHWTLAGKRMQNLRRLEGAESAASSQHTDLD